jgi:DNA-directed RNA polymerase specialized sigma24 family protein
MISAADPLLTSAPSFDRAIADHLPMIRRIAAAHESNASAREDVVQEILCAIWRALPNFRGEGSLRAFIARVPLIERLHTSSAYCGYRIRPN